LRAQRQDPGAGAGLQDHVAVKQPVVHDEGHVVAAQGRCPQPARRDVEDDVAPAWFERLIQRVLAGDLDQPAQMVDRGGEILIRQVRPQVSMFVHG